MFILVFKIDISKIISIILNINNLCKTIHITFYLKRNIHSITLDIRSNNNYYKLNILLLIYYFTTIIIINFVNRLLTLIWSYSM